MIHLFPARLIRDNIDNLRDNIAGTLHHHGVADADVAAVAQLFTSYAPDVVLVVQRDVLHDDAADADRLQLAHRREGAGATNLDLNPLENGDRAFGRKFMRNAPARRARYEAQPFLPVDAVDLVDDAINVVIELGAALLDLAMKGD